MRTSLLTSVAAIALIASPAFAQRQEAPPSRTESPARAPDSVQKAPAEKSAPSMERSMPNKSGTTGQGTPSSQSSDEMKSPSRSGTTNQDRPSNKSSNETKSPSRSGTTGQSTPSGRSGDNDAKPAPGSRAGDKPGTEMKPGADRDRPAAKTDTKPGGAAQAPSGNRSGGSTVNLTTEQKTKIRSTVLTSNAPRVSNVNFSVNVGTVIPKSVRVVAVPATLIEIHPEWRGHMYFVYNDQIVIVERDTLRIVSIIVV